MAIHKLADGPIVLTVASIEQTEGQFGTQYCFSDGNTAVYVSELATTQQLGRLKLDPDSALGATLAFEQIKKNGKTFTNITLANAGAAANAAASAPRAAVSAPRAPAQSMEEIEALYAQCVAASVRTLGRALDEAGIPQDGNCIQAGAATMFIKASR
jgi:hypothetical protein